MDIGIFKASRARLIAWIAIPPVLMTTVGLSSYALEQRSQWRLQQTKALSDVLPDVIVAQKSYQALFADMGLSKEKRIATEEQLITLLQEKARSRDVTIDTVQVVRRDKSKGANASMLSAIVNASGSFTAFQRYLNDIKTAQPLLSASSISLTQRMDAGSKSDFNLKIVFDLLLVDEIFTTGGGSL